MPARPWSLLVNGVIADDTLDAAVVTLCGRDALRADVRDLAAEMAARSLSRAYPHRDVALCRLGDVRSLVRFAGGEEIAR